MSRSVRNEPQANILMTSMRAMGYSFESAVADIIDNSISAQSKNIRVLFPVDPTECFVAIFDDGHGMSREELFQAMKYGSGSSNEERYEHDLGRFGLGLKSASLSQCKRLTVVSKKDGEISAFVWDIDLVDEDWLIQELNENEITQVCQIELLTDIAHGTLVVWEKFDIIEKTSGSIYSELSRQKESVANYLSLIFHRFLNKDVNSKINISINNFSLVGLDPFLERHNKTNHRRAIKLAVRDSKNIERYITVQPFVLPFQKDLSKEDIKMLGGITDYRTKQGFYVYRNERLIVWGTWFGRPRHELTKHARVKVDISNSLDDIWCIDIKKQSAQIPNIVKKQLTKAVDEAMDIAVRAQKFRGRIDKIDDNLDYIWNRNKIRDNQYIYSINRDSRIFDFVKSHVDDETWNLIDMVLEEIENAVPYQQIYIDKSQNSISDEVTDDRLFEVEAKAKMLITIAHNLGHPDSNKFIDELFLSEPFCKYIQLKEKVMREVL